MNGYKAFYKGKQVEVYATTSYNAQIEAALRLKAKRPYEVSVVLCEVSGKQVIHNASSL